MNILSFDIEEWYIEKKFHGGRDDKYRQFDGYLKRILDVLDENGLKATFFCVGRIATDFPQVVKEIAHHGHEIGCHSNEHMWLTKMASDELRKDTTEALKALQDVSGQKVVSFRAPAFSIGEKNKWAFEVLAECGIERDASVFPASRDFGGFPSFPTDSPVLIQGNGWQIQEFPITLATIAGKQVAYSGGGYFRLFPLWFVKNQMDKNDYNICYFHIGDLLPSGPMMSRQDYETYFKEPGTYFNRLKRHFKSSIGTSGAFDKMCKLISSRPFTNLADASASLTDLPTVDFAKL